jgi:hypothetical protein
MGVLRGAGGGLVGGRSVWSGRLLAFARAAVGMVAARGGGRLRQVVVERGRVAGVCVAQSPRTRPGRQRTLRTRRLLQSCRGTTSRHARYVVLRLPSMPDTSTASAHKSGSSNQTDTTCFPPRAHKKPAILSAGLGRGHVGGPRRESQCMGSSGRELAPDRRRHRRDAIGFAGGETQTGKQTRETGHKSGQNNHIAASARQDSHETPHGTRAAWVYRSRAADWPANAALLKGCQCRRVSEPAQIC